MDSIGNMPFLTDFRLVDGRISSRGWPEIALDGMALLPGLEFVGFSGACLERCYLII